MITVEQEEDVLHFGGVRIRVTGSGSLRMTFQSLDAVATQALAPITMAAVSNIEPFKLANFISQRSFLRVETTAINEIFKINRIVIFTKPIYTQYVGQ